MDVQKVLGEAIGNAMTDGTLGAWEGKPKVSEPAPHGWDCGS
jgi:hypothetical protein